jgi:hypothetical protein
VQGTPHRELGGILTFVAKVATAIRTYSAYSDSEPRRHAAFDLMWLSDCLHNLDVLGRAVQVGRPEAIAFACDRLLRQIAEYESDVSHYKSPPRQSFERNREHFELAEFAMLLRSLRERCNSDTASSED